MATQRIERRLAAILAADIAGYSRLMEADDEGTLARLKAHRSELIDPKIAEHRGRIVKTTGDGILIEFPSVIEAVSCAVALQRGMVGRNAGTREEQRITFRIGVNLGDIIVEDGDIHGDGVNIAARLEGIAEPGGICISDDAFRQVRGKVEAEFVDIGEQSLKNIARPLRVYSVRRASASEPRLAPAAGPPLPDKPSIAVLPFANMSGDPEQDYFADGMVEEIITALSRIRWLFVIARNSSFTYKGQAVDVKQVGRELGVRYVLEGSVRKAGGRMRITAQLIETESGASLWADHFDGSLEDVFDLQDRVATSVSGVIEPAMQANEIRLSTVRPTQDLTAYDLCLRALALWSSRSKEGTIAALGLFEQAIERDPNYGPALAAAAGCRRQMEGDHWAEDVEGNRQIGIEYARRALAVAEDDPGTIANAASALAFFGEDVATMIGLVDRALALNPSFARGWYLSAGLMLRAGDPDAAIERLETALRLSPRARVGQMSTFLGVAHFLKRRFDEALPFLLRGIQERPTAPTSHRWLAACYAHLGRLAEAREIIQRVRTLTPAVVSHMPLVDKPDHLELFRSGLRLAAGEET